jgi:superfamily II DNA helicase RecQ
MIPRAVSSRSLSHLPLSNPGGLDPQYREEIRRWCSEAPEIAVLRPLVIWTELHDRVAAFAPFLRAQEYSAQIERPILQTYEDKFKKGEINLLNCSTTMEMGVDIPNVNFVVNANVPPSASNYRQRVGRAGRRGAAFAAAMTFCRDLPLDWIMFLEPARLLSALGRGSVRAPRQRRARAASCQRRASRRLLARSRRSQCEGLDRRLLRRSCAARRSRVATHCASRPPRRTHSKPCRCSGETSTLNCWRVATAPRTPLRFEMRIEPREDFRPDA